MFQPSSAMDGSPVRHRVHAAGPSVPEDRLADAATVFLRDVTSRGSMLAGVVAVACGGVLLLRKLSGAIAAPPAAGTVPAVCAAGLVLVVVGDLAATSRSGRAEGPAMAWFPAILTRVGLLMALAALGLPSRDARLLDTLAALAAVMVSLAFVIRPTPFLASLRQRLETIRNDRAATPAIPASESTVPTAAVVPSTTTVDGSLRQRFERLSMPGGAECVRGRLCVAVSKGSRSGSGHVGFCPPLASQPTVDVVSDYDGVEAVVSAAEVLPWGVRIECRLDEPAEETIDIPVDILVTTAA